MTIDVVLTPKDLRPEHLANRAVVVFDVLRATTTMAAALTAGVREIRIFDSLNAAKSAAAAHHQPILCGEVNCLKPQGFDLGNSPTGFVPQLHSARTVFMSTTNGTRAIVAARDAKLLLVGAIVNAAPVADRLAASKLDVTLLCAGTNGEPAMEDLIGAGAVIDSLNKQMNVELASDVARIAVRLFETAKADLQSALADAAGGRNVIAAGLTPDIAFAANLNSIHAVGEVRTEPLRLINAS